MAAYLFILDLLLAEMLCLCEHLIGISGLWAKAHYVLIGVI